MVTRMQNTYDYTEYIKCGEILRPPCESTTRPYALRCFYCQEIYLLFEAFIFHIEDHCKNAINNMKPLPIDVHNTNQTKDYVSYDDEENQPSFVKTEVKPSTVVKAEKTSEESNFLIVTEDLNPPDDAKRNSSSTPLRSELGLKKHSQLNNSCSNKNMPRQRRALNKYKNNTTIMAKNNIKKNIVRITAQKILKVDKNDELKLESREKKVKQESNLNKNYNAIDDKCERFPICIEEEIENKADENLLLSDDDDVSDTNIETFGNPCALKINK